MQDIVFYGFSIIVVFSLFLLAIVSLLKQGYKKPNNRLFASFSALISLYIVSNIMAYTVGLLAEISHFIMYLIFMSGFGFLILLTIFIERLSGSRKLKTIVRLSLPFLWIICLISGTSFVVEDVGNHGTTFGPLIWLYFLGILYLIVLIVYGIINGLRNTRGLERRRLLTLAVGIIITLPIATLFVLVIPLLTGVFSFNKLGVTSTSILVFSLYYSVIRYHLFDIRAAAVRSLAYVLSLSALVGIYFGLATLVSDIFLRNDNTISQSPLSFILALVLLFIFQPIKKFFDHWTNKLFYRDYYNSDEFYARLNRMFASTTDLRSLLERTANEIALTLKSEQALFFIYTNGNHHVVAGTHNHTQITKTDTFTKKEFSDMLIKYGNKNRVTVTSMLDEDNPLRKVLSKLKIELMIPLMQDDVIGYLCLGDHLTSRYTTRDIKVLSTVTDGLAVAIQNALSIQKIKDINAAHIQERITAATSELQKSNDLLRHIDQEKNEFISIASHELRTPMTVIRGFINLLERQQLGDINDKQRDVLNKMSVNTKALIDLVNNMLDLSKLESGKLEINLADSSLDELVNQAIDEIKLLYETKGVTLEYKINDGATVDDKHADVMVHTDAEKFTRIMLNLLSNAHNFTDKGGSVKVTATTDHAKRLVTICVADTGVGIPAEVMDSLFKKFFQVDNYLQRQAGGTGLGLAISRQLVEKLGGTIWVESEVKKGSKFYFTARLSDKL